MYVCLLNIVGALEPSLHIHITHLLTGHQTCLLERCVKHIIHHHPQEVPAGRIVHVTWCCLECWCSCILFSVAKTTKRKALNDKYLGLTYIMMMSVTQITLYWWCCCWQWYNGDLSYDKQWWKLLMGMIKRSHTVLMEIIWVMMMATNKDALVSLSRRDINRWRQLKANRE